jgi:hypothetical protein
MNVLEKDGMVGFGSSGMVGVGGTVGGEVVRVEFCVGKGL